MYDPTAAHILQKKKKKILKEAGIICKNSLSSVSLYHISLMLPRLAKNEKIASKMNGLMSLWLAS